MEISFLIRLGGTAIHSSSVSMYSAEEPKLSSLMGSGVWGSSAWMEDKGRGGWDPRHESSESGEELSFASKSKSG